MPVSWITWLRIKHNTYFLMDIAHEIFIVGRSNAINIAERLRLPSVVIDTARKLYGSSSAEIDEVFLSYHNYIYYLFTVVCYILIKWWWIFSSQIFQQPWRCLLPMQVITDMEKLKQDYHKRLTEAQYYLMWDSCFFKNQIYWIPHPSYLCISVKF